MQTVLIKIRKIILIAIVIVIAATVGFTVSRYIRSAGGADNARVASFNTFTSSLRFPSNTIQPGVSREMNVTYDVSSSEVAVVVFVRVTPYGFKTNDNYSFVSSNDTIGSRLSFSLNNYWTYAFTDNDKLVYYKQLAPAESLNDVEVITDGLLNVDSTLTNSELSSIGVVGVVVQGACIQSGGFDTLENAYSSAFGGN